MFARLDLMHYGKRDTQIACCDAGQKTCQKPTQVCVAPGRSQNWFAALINRRAASQGNRRMQSGRRTKSKELRVSTRRSAALFILHSRFIRIAQINKLASRAVPIVYYQIMTSDRKAKLFIGDMRNGGWNVYLAARNALTWRLPRRATAPLD